MTTELAKHYRARITLEEVTELPHEANLSYTKTVTSEIAEISVTGGSPGAAMNQIVAHAQQLAAAHSDVIIAPGAWAAGVFNPVTTTAGKPDPWDNLPPAAEDKHER